MRIHHLPFHPEAPFPHASKALRDPNGLLAVGGDLSPQRLMNAYQHGIFPWYSEGDPILWWSPDPRMVFDTGEVHLSRRFRRQLRQCPWEIRVDHRFSEVIHACATTPRGAHNGTWILPEMIQAYERLHALGHAHSVEIYEGEAMIGGIYGVDAGSVFCGESMFSRKSGGSKVALAALALLLKENNVHWLDAQMHTSHLESLGAKAIPRSQYLEILEKKPISDMPKGSWHELKLTLEAVLLA